MTDVLLIESDPMQARAVQRELAGNGTDFAVVRVERLDEGIRRLGTDAFDVVLADLEPAHGGEMDELHRLLKAAKSTPVIVLSSGADEEMAMKVVQAGAQDYLVSGSDNGVSARALSRAIERAGIKRALLESEERFRVTFEQAAVGIAHVAMDGRYIAVNDRLCEILGYPREELMSLTFRELTVADDREDAELAWEAMLAGKLTRLSLEKRYVRKSGDIVWIELASTLLRGLEGEPKYFISVFNDISARKEAEASSRETRERYQSLFDRSLNAVYVCDLEGRFLDANPAALDLLGYTKEEIRGVDFSRLLTSREDLARALESVRGLVRSGADTEVSEYQLRRKDGELVWVEVLSSLVYEGGHPVAAQGIARDITDRRQAAAALAASEEQFRVIFEQAGIGLAMVDCENGRIHRCNEALARMLGYGVEELCALTVQDVSHPEDYQTDWELWHAMVDGKLPRFQMEKRYRRRDGQWVWGLLTSTLVRDEDGKPRFIIGMVEDVTDRKGVEEALRGAKETLQTIFDSAPVAILALDLEGRVTAWNAGAVQMFGWTAEEAAGRLCPTVPTDRRDEFRAMIERVAHDGPETGTLYERQRKDGKRLQVSISAGSLRDDGGNATGIMVILEDVAERRHREQVRRVESLGQVTANIAHEFNNVLMGIQPFVELIRKATVDERIQQFVSRIQQSVARGRKVTDEILRFTRGAEPVKTTIAVREWLEGFRAEGEVLLDGKLTLSIQVAPEPLRILGDLAQLNQVLCNLVINARDASAPGGTIRLLARGYVSEHGDPARQPDHVHVIVIDEGSGMDEAVLARIFDPLYTTKRGGTGLGLPICHQVVTAHGGRMFAESIPGQGTEMHILLPTTTREIGREGGTPRAPKPPGRVLIVDDEELVANGIRATLEMENVETAAVHRGADVQDAIVDFDPDVVLLDIGLPDANGVDVCRQILTRWPSRRVVFMTGHFGRESLDDLLRQPHVGMLQKPFSVDELLAILSAVIDGGEYALRN